MRRRRAGRPPWSRWAGTRTSRGRPPPGRRTNTGGHGRTSISAIHAGSAPALGYVHFAEPARRNSSSVMANGSSRSGSTGPLSGAPPFHPGGSPRVAARRCGNGSPAVRRGPRVRPPCLGPRLGPPASDRPPRTVPPRTARPRTARLGPPRLDPRGLGPDRAAPLAHRDEPRGDGEGHGDHQGQRVGAAVVGRFYTSRPPAPDHAGLAAGQGRAGDPPGSAVHDSRRRSAAEPRHGRIIHRKATRAWPDCCTANSRRRRQRRPR